MAIRFSVQLRTSRTDNRRYRHTGALGSDARLASALSSVGRILLVGTLIAVAIALLVTGSNMGRRSTILRAVGLSVVLAQCGAPCCCTELKMSVLEPLTSIKASDSLAHSRSRFMPQLYSIKHVIDRLKRVHAEDNVPPAIYIFDEIRNGTNASDRRPLVEQLIGYTL